MKSKRILSLSNINSRLLDVRYAVRGEIPLRASEIVKELKKNPSAYNFSRIAELNIGNPQFFESKKIESTRLVISHILRRHSPLFNLTSTSGNSFYELQAEASQLADEYEHILGVRNFYQNISSGVPQKSVAQFIEARDNLASNPNNIFSGNGASDSINAILNLLIDGPQTGIMCSVPTYPLYSALISLYGGSFVKYHLDEEDNWNVNVEDCIT